MLEMIDKKEQEQLQKYLAGRTQQISSDILMKCNDILADIAENKDEALKKYTEKFDGVLLNDFRVSEEEIEQAVQKADPAFKEAMEKAKVNIEQFHEKQKSSGYKMDKEKGIYLGQRVLPLESVGIYVPGGRAQYPSSVLMNAIPAKVAGVKKIVMVTPPSRSGSIHPNIAFAAKLAGVDEIYKIGGAQAIAALAYGTETIPAVDKIVGPGNIFVAAAKKLVYGKVDIDMIAGPSEILVIADEKANPAYVAADLISQAEHDPMASAILVTTSLKLAQEVNKELEKQSSMLKKKDIIRTSLKDYGKCIIADSLMEAVEISNAVAPEHLELQTSNPEELLPYVKNAGSVFMGYYSCESVGDYFGGTNHVLPTSGTARFSSALGVDSFVKRSSFLFYTEEALQSYGQYIMEMAHQEDLDGHANAVKVRMKNEEC